MKLELVIQAGAIVEDLKVSEISSPIYILDMGNQLKFMILLK